MNARVRISKPSTISRPPRCAATGSAWPGEVLKRPLSRKDPRADALVESIGPVAQARRAESGGRPRTERPPRPSRRRSRGPSRRPSPRGSPARSGAAPAPAPAPPEAKEPKQVKPEPKPAIPSRRPTFARVYVGDGNSLELVSLHVTRHRRRAAAPHGRRSRLPQSARPAARRHLRVSAADRRQSRATSPCSSARRATPCRRCFAPARRRRRRCRRRTGPTDARAARQAGEHRRLGHACRRPASSPRRRRWRPTRRSSAAASTRRCWSTPAATPSAAASSPSPPRATTASSSPTRNRCPFAGEQMCYRFPLPDCKLTETAVHPAGQHRRVQGRHRSCRRTPTKRRGRRPASTSRTTWNDKAGRAATSSSPARRATPQVQAISGRQGESGPLYLYARLRPELKVEAGQAVRRACRLPAGHVAERASRPLRREHEAARGRSWRATRTSSTSTSDLQRRRRLGRAEGLAATTRRPDASEAFAPARRPGAGRGHRLLGAPWTSWPSPGFADRRRDAASNVFVLSDGQITWGETGRRAAGGAASRRAARSGRASTATAPAWARRTWSCSRP